MPYRKIIACKHAHNIQRAKDHCASVIDKLLLPWTIDDGAIRDAHGNGVGHFVDGAGVTSLVLAAPELLDLLKSFLAQDEERRERCYGGIPGESVPGPGGLFARAAWLIARIEKP